MPILLIDAFNVLHVVGVLPPELAGPDLAGLGVLIERSRFRNDPATFYCDGRAPVPRPDLPRGIRAKWSGPDRPADDLIIAQIRGSTTPRRLLVVSSDRQIVKEAQRRRCGIMRSEAFMAMLARDAAAPPTLPGPSTPGILPADALPRWLQDEAAHLSKQSPLIDPDTDAESDHHDLADPSDDDEASEAGAVEEAVPAARRADPLFPTDILIEAAALLDEPPDDPHAADRGAFDPADPADDADPATRPSPPAQTDPLLAAFAEAMREAGEVLSRHRTRGRPERKILGAEPSRTPRDGMPRTPPRARSPILPSDILAEAERLLDEAERRPSDDPPAPPSETPGDLPS